MKKLIIVIVALLAVGGGSFYAGMKYAPSRQHAQIFQANVGGNFQGGTFQRGNNSRNAGNFLAGEVIAKDEQSLTLKAQDNSSKIIFFSDSTQISKMAEGTIEDVAIGKQIMVTGTQNSDGSYTAKTIQLSPRVIQPEK